MGLPWFDRLLREIEEIEGDRIQRSDFVATQYVLLIFVGLSCCFLLFFAGEALLARQMIRALVLGLAAAIIVIDYACLPLFKKYFLFRTILQVMMTALFLFLLVTGGEDGSGILWIYLFPVISFHCFGLRSGTLTSAFFFACCVGLLFALPGDMIYPYPLAFRVRIAFTLFAITVMSRILEKNRQSIDAKLHANLVELRERETEIRAYNARMREELTLASQLQQTMLAQSYPDIRAQKGGGLAVEFAHRYLPAGEVGGDFFYIRQLAEDRISLLLCDVMGHGVRAALVTAMLRALIESYPAAMVEPGRLLTRINKDVGQVLDGPTLVMFTTAAAVLLDLRQGEIHYALAGHHPLCLLRPDTGKLLELAMPKTDEHSALGIMPDTHYETHTERIFPGDVALLFTDGLFDVVNASGETFNYEKLLQVLRAEMQYPLGTLIDRILKATQTFAAGCPPPDDICLVAVAIHELKTGRGTGTSG
ncbi:MAG: serine/threonine-protein phosphatase [Verrucomicrobia bacterium]|nr:serine/threonine-protein phosphatase [Verrucomicrobiota bacterium]